MLNAILQLIGLRPRDRREVWHEKPVVITDEDGKVIFSGTATIEYTPGPEAYEQGHAEIFDEDSGANIFSLEVTGQKVYSTFNQANPYRLRWNRLGLTALATGEDGRKFKLYVGRHALSCVLRGRTLDEGSGDLNEIFAERDQDRVESEKE